MKYSLLFPAVFVLSLLTACSGPSLARGEAVGAPPPVGASFEAQKDSAPRLQAAQDGLVQEPDNLYATPRQIKTGSVSLETSDPKAVEKALTDKLKGLGGYVESSVATTTTLSLSLRIPAASFDGFLEGLTAWGRVIHRQVSVSDVTLQYYDLETRLKNQRLLLDQYRTFLSQTKKMDEILDAMERISNLTTQIESTEGQFRYLSRQISFSTLQVELSSPFLTQGRDWPDWSRGWSDLAHDLADFGTGTVFFLLAFLVVAPVILGLVALLVWLFLGKPGLWRRLKSLRATPSPK